MANKYGISVMAVTILAHLLGIASITLVLVWILHFGKGLALKSENVNRVFNAHPFFMLLGLVFLGGEAMMAYKTVPASRNVKKFVHMSLHLVALLLGALGLYAAFKFHRDSKLADMCSLHSWLGISTICLYALQWLVGCFFFLFPGGSMMARANMVPWHAFFGVVIFLMAIVSTETGLMEKFISTDVFKGSEALLVNFLGLSVLLFGITTILSVTLPRA